MAFVKTEVQGAVEIITIDRPKALNALNPEVLADLKAAFEAVDQETVRCIVLTGEGDKSFVAGADIGSMSTMTKAEGEACKVIIGLRGLVREKHRLEHACRAFPIRLPSSSEAPHLPSAVQKTVPLLLPCILPLRPCSQTAPDSAGSPQGRTEACILQGIANGAEAADTVAEIRPRSRQVPQNPDCF